VIIKNGKLFFIPIILFLITFTLDSFVTHVGLSSGFMEGNPIILWLWKIFGNENIFLILIYPIFIIFISFLIGKKLSTRIGLTVLYSFGIGHLFGFSSWVYPKLINFFTFGLFYSLWQVSIYILIFFAILYGFVLTFLHLKFIKG